MTDKSAVQPNHTPVAILHCTGSVVRGIVGTPGPEARLTSWREFSAEDTDRISAWLDESGAHAVLAVLPASSVVCRTCTLPDLPPEQLDPVLALQAEAHRLTDVPDHRRARAVLPMAPGETSRSGILLAWPQRADDHGLPGAKFVENRPRVTFVPDVAALAALLNGQRSDTPLMFFDRRDGSVALVLSHAQGAVIRAARIDNGGDDVAAAIGRVIAETALNVNHTPEFTEQLVSDTRHRIRGLDAEAGLVAPVDVIADAARRLAGSPGDPKWWQEYGVAAGALLAAGGPLASLTTLRLETPAVALSRPRQLITALSTPRRAAIVVAVSLLIVLFGPWVFSGLRLGVLSLKLPELDRDLHEAQRAEVQLAMYQELKEHAWPMTKLLADVACCTPESIDVEQIRIKHGERITISGRAREDSDRNLTAQQVVAQMAGNLHDTGVFTQIYLTWGDPNNFDAYEFSLTAVVVNPYRIHEYPIELDYGRWTLADRLYGDGHPPDAEGVLTQIEEALPPDDAGEGEPADDAASSDRTPSTIDEPANGTRPRGRTRPGPPTGRGSDDAGFRGSDRSGSSGVIPMSQDIPEPITPAEVAVMDLAEAQEAYRHLSQALQQARVDEDTKKRLWSDWRLIRERVRELKAAEVDSP